MVEPDTEGASAQVLKASQTVNKYGNRWWSVVFLSSHITL